MQIRVKCGCGEECQEWTIVEVQGVVEVQPAFREQFQNLEIGKLCRPSSQETYTFTVGYHELTGSKVPLKKPLVVLKKVEIDASGQETASTHKKVELEVVGIIRQRILFKTRPKALISSKFHYDSYTITTSGGEEEKAVPNMTKLLSAFMMHASPCGLLISQAD
ncbi:unnamed protein product [Rhodiola kirilowii]